MQAIIHATGIKYDCLIVAIELLYVIGERNVAGADASLAILYNDVDGKPVVAIQLAVYRQRIELIHLARRLTYAPAHQHGYSLEG